MPIPPNHDDTLLTLINSYNSSREQVTKLGNQIIKIICDALRDVIPDMEGSVGTIDSPNVLFFSSNEQSSAWENKDSREIENWESLDQLIEKVFPEIKYDVDDNCIYLPPDKQKIVIERLKKLRG